MMRCGSDGVPKIVQTLYYDYSDMAMCGTFFNGEDFRFSTDRVCPRVELTQRWPTIMQLLEAENNIIRIFQRLDSMNRVLGSKSARLK